MAKKFVRGITDIKTIDNQDFDTNNVNDLLSDGEHNYIHRKKGKTEEYHNLTDNLKTVSSDNTDLLTVTNDNDTTNSATLHPQHDTQKEQLIEAANNTITIASGNNATNDKTKIKVSDELVDTINNKQDKLSTGKGLSLKNNILNLEFSSASEQDANNLVKGNYLGANITNAPSSDWYWISNNVCVRGSGTYLLQIATKLTFTNNDRVKIYVRTFNVNVWTSWRELLIDKLEINDIFNTKQNKLSSNNSIAVLSNNELRQVFYNRHTYAVSNGFLKTHVRSVSENTAIDTALEEFNFTVKIKQNAQNISLTLTEHDVTAFTKLMNTYGTNNTVRISGCVFTLSGSTLTVSTANNTEQNYVITFSDII